MKRRIVLIAAAATLAWATADAQEVGQGFVHSPSAAEDYVWPTDTAVLRKLGLWQDLKFGVLFHWGLYSVPGIVESWSICSEDEEWIRRPADMAYDDYKRWYWGLKDSLNPVNFNPGQWADAVSGAGAKYMIFTTKHHDGFCMFDSRHTDFSIAHGPFAADPRRDVARHVLDAFRDRGFMVGCYFSKPDWHCPWFWSPYFATPNRHANYDRARHPDWWRRYQSFTQAQMEELTTNYGPIDILWLDGGWVRGEDVNLPQVLGDARKRHPGLLSVDRTIRGENENYQTPERGIPPTRQDTPWESCIPLSDDWGWTPGARFKSMRTVVGLLAETVAKGGSLLLGVGPTADGVIEEAVVARLREVGEWLAANGEAIYATRPAERYNDGRMWFTTSKDGGKTYAIYALPDGEELPAAIEWSGNVPRGRLTLLRGGRRLRYRVEGDKVVVSLPRGLRREPIAMAFEVVR